MKSVGERIRQARNARQMSAEVLAKRVGYAHQSAIANLENRANGTGGTKLPVIAAELNVPVAWLLEGPDSDTVPFLRTAPVQQVAPSAVHVVQEHDPFWPFRTIRRERIDRLLARLGRVQAETALDEMERQLHILLSHWEREADAKNSDAA